MRQYLFDYPRLKDFPREEPDTMLVRALKDTDLKQLKHELNVWCQIGIISETKAYHTQEEREVIQRFCSDFYPLIDALFCIGKALADQDNEAIYSEVLADYISNYYKPEDEILGPFEFIEYFFSSINIECTRSLLWVLFEAVVIYRGELEKQMSKEDIVLMYERFLVIAESAFSIKEKRKQFDKE